MRTQKMKTTETYVNPHLLYIFFALAAIGILVSVYAIIGVQNNSNNIKDIDIPEVDTFNWRNATGFWVFINDNYASEQELNSTRDDIKGDVKLNKDQITANKKKINLNHPVDGNVPDPDPGTTSPTDTPFFTVSIEQNTYSVGENIVFSGVGLPGKPVFIVIKAPDNSMAPQGATVANENGEWVVEFSTEFDWPLGTWSYRATQLQERSDFFFFELVE